MCQHELVPAQRQHRAGDDGNTLIELLTVVLIIGILAAIAIPVFMSQTSKARDASLRSDLHVMATLQEAYIADNPSMPGMFVGPSTAGGSLTISTANDFRASPGNQFRVIANSRGGYCISAWNAQASASFNNSSAGKVMIYDSSLGGLQKAGVACA